MVTDTSTSVSGPQSGIASRLLKSSGALWFLVAAFGQLVFATYILAAYTVPTVTGDYATWNSTGLIDGYKSGDGPGNFMFIAHVLLAAFVSVAGPLQLLEPFRRRFPTIHRMTGRAYITIAAFMALGGLWLVWVRGTYITILGGIAVSLDGILILIFGGVAVYFAIQRRIDRHRPWALRLFVVMSGVWFVRLGYGAWLMNVGPVGITRTMSGYFDIFIAFGAYVVPLLVLELYLWAQRTPSAPLKLVSAGVTSLGAGLTAAGVIGAATLMWLPHF